MEFEWNPVTVYFRGHSCRFNNIVYYSKINNNINYMPPKDKDAWTTNPEDLLTGVDKEADARR